MHQGGRKGAIVSSREAGKDHLDSLGGTREAPGAVKGNPVLRELCCRVEDFRPQV